MEKGRIKTFDQVRGYGFIETEDGDDVYFSQNDIHPKFKKFIPKEGLNVGFDVKRELKGDRAINVRFL